MKNIDIFSISFAGIACANSYRVQDLSTEDARRAACPRSPGAALDWRVSRALLHAVRGLDGAQRALSLSHKHGHAICASAPAGWRVGADLERIRARDALGLAAWVCAPAERQHLAQLSGAARLECFHVLWTLKESFIKAAGLAFPRDMARVGLDWTAGPAASPSLRAPPGPWRTCTWRLGPQWLASCVWSGQAAPPGWRTLTGGQSPGFGSPVLLGAFSSC